MSRMFRISKYLKMKKILMIHQIDEKPIHNINELLNEYELQIFTRRCILYIYNPKMKVVYYE